MTSLLSITMLAACTGGSTPDGPAFGTVTFEGGASLEVRIADDDEERRRGLMGVTSLAADEGMVFEFPEPTDGSFWMQDTLIPLSIAFIDELGHVVTVLEMEPCTEEPCPAYAARAPYVLAVEANAGWFDEHGVEEGDRMEGFVGRDDP
ncbi:MAG TPA: DUF192 domain-containing protein [Actinomycetota bacterium]|nr:DUF192 domain-containing protein [Actinomycetota bacterium]